MAMVYGSDGQAPVEDILASKVRKDWKESGQVFLEELRKEEIMVACGNPFYLLFDYTGSSGHCIFAIVLLLDLRNT